MKAIKSLKSDVIKYYFIFVMLTVMWAHQMSVQDYQDLIDRGWRR